jgi:DNA (cytosine-5)-methyltransferase 1
MAVTIGSLLICGGFPCQDVSVAGAGAGIESGERSSLWWEFRRIVRQVRPSLVFIENVHGGWRRWLPLVRRSLARLGYASLPLRVSAADVGAPHERARVFVLAYADGERLEERPLRWARHERAPAARGGAVADGDGARLSAVGLAQQAGIQGAAGALAHRRYPAGWKFPPGPADIHAWDGPKPAVRRAADGLTRWMDKARLQALGNAVVPYAAARAWLTLAPLVPGLAEERAA